ncbi:hypothetical protein HHJ46_16000 [Escherichia coli]|nr:hypothetical protein HHJ46_16000 [Escherichia coli]
MPSTAGEKNISTAGVRAPVQTYQVLPAPGAAPAEPLPLGSQRFNVGD